MTTSPDTEEAAVTAAVRRVLGAVNISTKGFALEEGFVQRALSRNKPRMLGINGILTQLSLVGRRSGDPETVTEQVAAAALDAMSEAARKACQRLIVAWIGDGTRAYAAVFVLTDEGGLGPRTACSWLPPQEWTPPLIDQELPPDQVLDRALERLQQVVASRGTDGSAFDANLDRALTVVDVALRFVQGEAQDRSFMPSRFDSDEVWATWLAYYEASLLNEWRRTGQTSSRVVPAPPPDVRPQASVGKRVFLSYARPDATSFAWPVHRALEATHAHVWFDQRVHVDDDDLDTGFADAIARCDAFVLCATPELFERSGYATQEVAWAVEVGAGQPELRRIAVVPRGTELPSRLSDWSKVVFDRDHHSLAAALDRALNGPATAGEQRAIVVERRQAVVPELAPVADPAACLRRARHTERFLALPNESLIGIMNYVDNDRKIAAAAALLASIGKSLDWSGHLSDIEAWPPDSSVRDMRFRMACGRALVGIRHVPQDSHEADLIAGDIEFLCKQRVPILDWPVVAGWDEHSRNLAVRYHLGVLRVLTSLVAHGSYMLAGVPYEVVDGWAPYLRDRVVECLDFALEQRLNGSLSWRDQPQEWDHFYVAFKKALGRRQDWLGPAPTEALEALLSHRAEVAAAAADVVWVALRAHRSQRQWLALETSTRVDALVSVRMPGPEAPPLPPLKADSICVELSFADRAKPTLRIAWKLSWASRSVGVALAPVADLAP